MLSANVAYQPRRALRAVGWMRLFGEQPRVMLQLSLQAPPFSEIAV